MMWHLAQQLTIIYLRLFLTCIILTMILNHTLNNISETNNYAVSEATFSLRYSHKEKFITQHYRRGSLGSNYPIITLSYTKGLKVNNGLI